MPKTLSVRLPDEYKEKLEIVRSQVPSMSDDSKLIRWLIDQEKYRHEGSSKEQVLNRVEGHVVSLREEIACLRAMVEMLMRKYNMEPLESSKAISENELRRR